METKSLSVEHSLSKSLENKEVSSNEKVITEVEVKPVEGTPFCIYRETKESPWRIVIGNDIVSKETFIREKNAIRYIMGKPWMLILTAARILAHRDSENKTFINNKNEQ